MKSKKCKSCGKLFSPRDKIQVNCGSRKNRTGCAFKFYKEFQRIWVKKRRDELLDIEKKYYKLLKVL